MLNSNVPSDPSWKEIREMKTQDKLDDTFKKVVGIEAEMRRRVENDNLELVILRKEVELLNARFLQEQRHRLVAEQERDSVKKALDDTLKKYAEEKKLVKYWQKAAS